MSTRIDHARMEKIASKAFAWSAHDMIAGTKKLNILLDEGWLVETQQIINDVFIAILKQECPTPRIVYVDVGSADSQTTQEIILQVKKILQDSDGEDVFIPVTR